MTNQFRRDLDNYITQSDDAFDEEKKDPEDADDFGFLTCEECGNEQADMGRNVACEHCGARMPEPEEEEPCD